MNTEIITIGDEIITGLTIDTNAAFIARELTASGFGVKYQTSVGDEVEAMEEAFRLALNRVQIVIVTGGLGPTDDDITKKVIVRVFKRNLVFHEEILEEMKERFTRRGMEMPAINQNQALLPQGARFFSNKFGSAPGICIAEKGRIFISLPGVPSEMRQLMTDEIIPYLTSLKTGRKIFVINLRTTGITESKLAEMIGPSKKLKRGVKLAYLPSYSGVVLRIISTAETEQEAQDNANKLARQIESVCGKYIFDRDDESLEAVVGQLLKDNDKTLACAESCSGGQLGMTLTSVPGSSDFFPGGIIAYSNDAKTDQLHVDPEIIKKHGAVSEECAKAMATEARKLFDSSYALSITGIAGPDGGSDDKPVGTTWIGLASAQGCTARLFLFGNSREANRTRAVYAALEILRREILDID